jgi:hypothetical protein
MQSVFGPDGKQQRVSFNTNATSKEEMSSVVSVPDEPMLRGSRVGVLPMASLETNDGPRSNGSGPTRRVDKHKREHLSPYRCPKMYEEWLVQDSTCEGCAALEAKTDEKAKEDQIIESSSLALLLTEPNTLTGSHGETC